MKDHKRETAKLLTSAANELVRGIANQAFKMWEREDFRMYTNFKNIPISDQDRIYNELQVSLIGLYILNFEQAILDSDDEKKKVLSALQNDLTPAYLNLFAELGMEKKFIKQWKNLIDLRVGEYKGDLQIALSESVSMSEFKDEEALRKIWIRIETITIACLSHIRKGKIAEDDPLWQLLRKWFISMDTQLTPITSA